MKSSGLRKHVAIAFVIALATYFFSYSWIEYRRTHKGPWQVSFTHDHSGAPLLIVNQTNLAITNLAILFPVGSTTETNAARTLRFDTPRQVPFDLPFGQCVFMDTTFQPGTIVLKLFGHEIQLIPRVLTIDQREIQWPTNANVRMILGNRQPLMERRAASPGP